MIQVVLNSSQFQCLDENKYIPLSLTNDENHEKSCILINNDQIENIKHRIEKLKIESEDKNDGSKQIVTAINEYNLSKNNSERYQEKFKEMMVLKLSTILPTHSINTLFEESNEQELSKLEKEIKQKEKDVTKALSYKIKDIKELKKHKLELMKENTSLLKQLNDKKEAYQKLISKIDKEKETSLN